MQNESAPQPSPQEETSSSGHSWIWIVVCLCFAIAWFSRSGDPKNPPLGPNLKEKERLQVEFSHDMQMWFDRFHPMGTAQSITVHEAAFVKTPSGPQTAARFTIYWNSPLISDGFTKVLAMHDNESRRWSYQILETNGTTNQKAGEAALVIGSQLLLQALKDE